MKLSLYEQETDYPHNQAEATAEAPFPRPKPAGKAAAAGGKYPDQIVSDRQTFTVPKRCVSRSCNSAERRKAASERAKAVKGTNRPSPKRAAK